MRNSCPAAAQRGTAAWKIPQQIPQYGKNWSNLGSEQRLTGTQATALEITVFCLSHSFPKAFCTHASLSLRHQKCFKASGRVAQETLWLCGGALQALLSFWRGVCISTSFPEPFLIPQNCQVMARNFSSMRSCGPALCPCTSRAQTPHGHFRCLLPMETQALIVICKY